MGLCLLAAAPLSSAQEVVSAQSGQLTLTRGQVLIDGDQAERGSTGFYPALEVGQEVETLNGAAEILLTPGAFLRLAPGASIRMLDNRLSATHVEVLRGEVLLEVMDLYDDNSITVRMAQSETTPFQDGFYYFNLNGTRQDLRVFDGKARSKYGRTEVAVEEDEAGAVELTKGRLVAIAPDMTIERFDTGDEDDTWLFAFSKDRSEQIWLENRVAENPQRKPQGPKMFLMWVPGGGLQLVPRY